MEAAVVIACACVVWAAGFVSIGGPGRAEGELAVRVGLRLARRLALIADALGASPAGAWLLGRPSVRELCDEVVARRPGALASRERACGLFALATVAAALLCASLSRSAVGLFVAPACVACALPAWASARRRRERAELAAEMPGVFRTLAMALGSGETLSQAIEYVGVNGAGSAGRAFARASLSLRCGATAQAALEELSSSLDAPGVGLLVSALLISQRTGSPLVALLQRSATLVERAGEFERLLQVKTAQVRLSVRVVCLMPVVLVAGLSLMSQDFQRGLMTPVGLGCVLMASLADVVAVIIIRHIMSGVL